MVLAPVIANDVQPVLDERVYLGTATGYESVLRAILSGEEVNQLHATWAYNGGRWPPLNGLTFGLAALLFDAGRTGARVATLLASALTTPLVYLLTKRLSTRRAATIAGGIHVLYFSFVAFSHYLWSETLYILFLLLVVWFATYAGERASPSRGLVAAILVGVALGAAGLNRKVALLLFVIVPLWLIWRQTSLRSRIVVPLVVGITACVVLLPWEATLYQREGRFVALASGGGRELYVGNNPYIPPRHASCLSDDACKATLEAEAELYAAERDVPLSAAQRALAIAHIVDHPFLFFKNSFAKLRVLWSLDTFPFRHFLRATYPPISNALLSGLWIVALVMYLLFFGAAFLGFAMPSPALKDWLLLLTIIIVGSGLSSITTGSTRHNLPHLALMLPAAGHAVAHLSQARPRLRVLASVAMALLLVSIVSTLPEIVTKMYASSHYAPIVSRANSLLGIQASVTDEIAFRALGEGSCSELIVAPQDAAYEFNVRPDSEITLAMDQGVAPSLQFVSFEAHEPLSIELRCQRMDQPVVLVPVNPAAWQTWQPAGIEGIQYSWMARDKIFPIVTVQE